MTTILAIDLGKYKSTACEYLPQENTHTFEQLPTHPEAVRGLIERCSPDGVVIEVGSQAGWVRDLCQQLGVPIEIANPNHDAWRWKNVKRKTDRDDALELAKLSAVGQLPTVQLPDARTRQWRGLIAYRSKLISRRTAIRNGIRSLLDRQGLWVAVGKAAWSGEGLERLSRFSRDLEDVTDDELWRGRLAT